MPFVSVLIPVFNEEKYIEQCLCSLQSQTYPVDKMEWIIIDGDSKDRTRDIIERFKTNHPIKLLINEKHSTPISLNMGVQEANGEFIIRLDAHSLYPEDYIMNCVECLLETNADNVGGWIRTESNGFVGNAIARVLSSPFGVGNSSFRTKQDSAYVDTVPYGAFRKTVFEEIGWFNENLLRSEDNDINARIIENGGKIFLSEKINSVYYCRDNISDFLLQGLKNGNALFRTLRINPRAMRIRHYIPFTFLLSLLVLPFLYLVVPGIKWLLFLELTLYLVLDLYFSFVKNNVFGFITLWLFPLYHLSYGLGSLLGLIGVNVF